MVVVLMVMVVNSNAIVLGWVGESDDDGSHCNVGSSGDGMVKIS